MACPEASFKGSADKPLERLIVQRLVRRSAIRSSYSFAELAVRRA
jgi:hypothetical protein